MKGISRNKEGPLYHWSTKSQENLQEHLHNSCSRANREIPGNTWETGGGWTLLQVSKENCGVSTLGMVKTETRHSLEPLAAMALLWAEGLVWATSRGTFWTSVILWKSRQSKLNSCSMLDFKDYVGRCGNTSHADLSKEREDLPCFYLSLGKIKRWRKPGPV